MTNPIPTGEDSSARDLLPAYQEITVPWALLFAVRAWIRYRILSGQDIGVSDTVLVVLTGWPAFAALLLATYGSVTWRLRRLDAPPVSALR